MRRGTSVPTANDAYLEANGRTHMDESSRNDDTRAEELDDEECRLGHQSLRMAAGKDG